MKAVRYSHVYLFLLTDKKWTWALLLLFNGYPTPFFDCFWIARNRRMGYKQRKPGGSASIIPQRSENIPEDFQIIIIGNSFIWAVPRSVLLWQNNVFRLAGIGELIWYAVGFLGHQRQILRSNDIDQKQSQPLSRNSWSKQVSALPF